MLLNNRYQVIRTLGSGGFGETFLAQDTNMPSQRLCVVKQLKPIQNNPQIYQLVKERFQREAAILETLGSASDQIPALYAYFSTGGEFYLVQEWIEGDTLTAKMQKQGLFTASAIEELLVNILPVLEYVHGQHIVHRDIKPDNIILRHSNGKPVLIDFGAVRESMGTALNSQGNPTSSIVIGTPGFMPSEQAAGRPVYASDLYSLGLTAIYLLTGKQPQQLETDPHTAEIVWRHFASHIHPHLAGVIDKAIAYHPRERFASAREMLNALQIKSVSNSQSPVTQTIIAPPLQNTVTVNPGNTIPPENQNNKKAGMILPSLIASSLIGGSIIIGFAINKPSPSVKSENNTNTTVSSTKDSVESSSPNQEDKNTESSKNTSSQFTDTTQTQINRKLPDKSVVNNSYFVADSAFKDLPTATQQVRTLQVRGYSQAGIFWIPDYPNLSGKLLYEVYASRFSDRTNCINFLKTYGQVNSDAYCALASKDANTSPDRVYFKEIFKISISEASPVNTKNSNTNNYFWLSQRPVTEPDLVGKSGYELDIMRNTIFAVHGRRFDTPGLQDYFNQKSWYNPQYSPKQFPVRLLSKLEIENAEFINQYQERYNLRHF
ncbi:YARHG domain-containing protein [Sphaerospermopsis aphanizomenoides BCCUSP55]|uniref:protein kinase domain-containing protein n=1 Tax=Sphaerospermopsis aphanizomenoides TaxID=459663 RepID=UPI001906F252|nr:YARHG domain-containing protein [Sphaerospermopsis aphanizomenoides]MBK1988003.1 YARHG domain-containing protein [Sphaerospermopsis aphanizomenoides BCCUSP55]